jgi:FlaA1/EpsC-like NDP-sugar epimerase
MGIPIRGSADTIASVLQRYRIEDVILSTAAIDGERERQVREVCAARGIPVKRFRLEISE